jgi:hypothetical protein
MLKKLIGFMLCTLLIFTPIISVIKAGNEPSISSALPDEQAVVSTISPPSESRDGWELQWTQAYGGNGEAEFAQPIGDIDGDGINEIIIGGYETTSMCRIIYYNITQKTYVQEYSWVVGGGVPSGACVADLNGDGNLILCVSWAYSTADGVYAYQYDGTTLTQLDWYHGIGVDFIFDIYVCDYNDDGSLEVLIANAPNMGAGDKHVSALGWDSGNQQFSYETSWSCPGGASMECPMVWSGDVDNDDLTEVIADVSNGQSSTAGTWALNWNDDTQTWDGVPVWTNYWSQILTKMAHWKSASDVTVVHHKAGCSNGTGAPISRCGTGSIRVVNRLSNQSHLGMRITTAIMNSALGLEMCIL